MLADRHVVVVGASLAGVRAADALRLEGFTGKITVIGAEAHLPYDRPPLSKQLLSGAWPLERIWLRPDAAEYERQGIVLRLGERAVGLDLDRRCIVTDRDEQVRFDGAIVATGARVRMLSGTAAGGAVHVVRTLDDSQRLHAAMSGGAQKLVVIGAGFIGAEVAATGKGLGLDVTVLEALPVPLERQLGAEMGAACGALHGRHGVTLRCGVAVAGIETGGTGDQTGVRLADGSLVPADIVVVGVGVAPNIEWLEGSGVRLGNGIECDEQGRVLDNDGRRVLGVAAAGDVARWPNSLFGAADDPAEPEAMRVEHWTNAAEMGAHVATTVLADLSGDPVRALPFRPIPYFWSDQYDAKIQFLGRSTSFDEVRVVDGSTDDGKWVALYRRGDRLVGALGVSRIRQLMGYRKLLSESASWAEAMAVADAARS